MCLFSAPDPPPPPPPTPKPPPKPMQKVKKVESPARSERKLARRRGGQRSLVINRTTPKIGSKGTGATY